MPEWIQFIAVLLCVLQFCTAPNGHQANVTYDAINRLLDEAVTDNADNVPESTAYGNAGLTTAYAYDAANNRSSKAVTTSSNTVTTSYAYNNLNQLTGYTDGTRSVALTYDADGNRITRVVTGGSDDGTDTYSYDFENRLIGLAKGTNGGAGTYAYTYDYRTRRIVRDESQAGGVLTDLVFSGGTSVQEYSGTISSTNLQVEYIRGSDYGGGVGGILYTIRNGTPSYTHANKRGDIVAKTDGSGNLTFQDQYDGNGDQVATTGSTADRQKDNSKDVDPWGGINEGLRYTTLEDGLRTFMTRDPLGMLHGPNEYTYVDQNPWTHFDPEGLETEEEKAYRELESDPTVGDVAKANADATAGVEKVGVTVAKTIQTAAELTPMQNAATAITGKDAIGNPVSKTQQAMAIVGAVVPELKAAGTAVKTTEEAATVINDANKATTAATKAENSAKDVAVSTGAATKSSESGVVYKVPGKDTPSGDPYVGRTSSPEGPAGRGSADGRDRTNADVVDSYSTTQEGKVKEQQAIDANGGVKNLDNKRNEIADKNRAANGLPPPPASPPPKPSQ